MDYKTKYERALGVVKKLHRSWKETQNRAADEIEEAFPELKESGDEKIRKAILELVKQSSHILNPMNQKSMIAWLEKQGEKIDAIENLDTEFEKQVSYLIASAINKEHKYNEGFVKWTANALLNYAKQELEKQGEQKFVDKCKDCNNVKGCITCTDGNQYAHITEQKPVWSEEDEKTIDEAISLINMLASGYGEKVTEPITFNGVKMINNIKERLRNLHQKPNHWKPSDEQMEALLKLEEMHVLEHEKNQENAHLYMVIKSLKEQLWKLKKGE